MSYPGDDGTDKCRAPVLPVDWLVWNKEGCIGIDFCGFIHPLCTYCLNKMVRIRKAKTAYVAKRRACTILHISVQSMACAQLP